MWKIASLMRFSHSSGLLNSRKHLDMMSVFSLFVVCTAVHFLFIQLHKAHGTCVDISSSQWKIRSFSPELPVAVEGEQILEIQPERSAATVCSHVFLTGELLPRQCSLWNPQLHATSSGLYSGGCCKGDAEKCLTEVEVNKLGLRHIITLWPSSVLFFFFFFLFFFFPP